MPSTPKPNRTGRKRRALGWTLTAAGLLLAALWCASRWSGFQLRRGEWSLFVSGGVAGMNFTPGTQAHSGFSSSSHTTEWTWGAPQPGGSIPTTLTRRSIWPATYWSIPGYSCWELTLWPFPLLLCTIGALLLKSGRRAHLAMINHCTHCRYNLAGLAANAPCPECGGGGGGGSTPVGGAV